MTAPLPGTPVPLWPAIAELTAWLDAANPRTDHEVAMRIMKIGEEYGEAAAAYIGVTGQNPRKGVHATPDDLAAELCDVAVTALVALTTVTGGPGPAEHRLHAHLARLLARARPEGPAAGPGA
ncbi:MazG-like family protein [Bailinhaonella thermotolerans]|uniref:NTP pyrophosphohydrolase MazG putative catalytic core domain-containing protein n=1 Tax=Bailinhaonella thermotolerans TaxID=1070861 RepID=A0A3A4AFR0_9ACTN|nr:MazG-like family protein [Bailinhaonella thermotolerans]RJL24473.1 hypothetical protein D5H75_29575 [Bailinhaonella thermotolerans]